MTARPANDSAPAAGPRSMAASNRWRERLTSPGAAVAVLALFYAVLLGSVREKSATFDEPGHVTAGYAYWKFGDYRLDPENGNLSKRWIALPLLFTEHRFPAISAPGWSEASALRLGDEWLNRQGNDTTALLFGGRAMSALVAVALGAVVWLWSRRWFGGAGAMVSLLLYTTSPIVLAHGPLMTSDAPAALGLLLAVGSIWHTLHHVTLARILAGTLAIAGLFLAKMSAVLIIPMAAILAVARIAQGKPLPLGRTRVLRRRSQQALALSVVALMQTAGVVALVWACYGFRYEAFSPHGPVPGRFSQSWPWALGLPGPRVLLDGLDLDASQRAFVAANFPHREGPEAEWSFPAVARVEEFRTRELTAAQREALDAQLRQPPPRWIPRLVHFARQHRLLPEAFLFGYAHVWKTSGKLAAFMNGEIRQTGWLAFFPFTFAVKTRLAFLALAMLTCVAAIAALRTRAQTGSPPRGALLRHWLYRTLPLSVLFATYWAVALSTNLNIGHRHLLPVYPPLFVACGALGLCLTRPLRFAAAALLGIAVVESALWFPNYLAYFNGLVRPRDAYRHLVDSSLDWGQDLPAVAEYLRAHRGEPAHLAYFGPGSPAYYRIDAQHLGGFPAMDWKLNPPLKTFLGATGSELAEFQRQHPHYDPDLAFRLDGADRPGVLLVQKSSAHQLRAGLYLISASMLQPLYCGRVSGFWDEAHERDYRVLRGALSAFLSDDRDAKIAALPQRPVHEWLSLFNDYYDFRLARLATYLRSREPDDTINYSVLVYRLNEAEVARALEGALP